MTPNTTRVAVVITCHDRKEKTVSCISNLKKAEDYYNSRNTSTMLELSLYITDDGCTDGTVDAVRGVWGDKGLTILTGDGNLYWARGMRLAWNKALADEAEWDFYLLVNDDTFIYEDGFEQLIKCHEFSIGKYGKSGIYSGITCDVVEKERITYGGYVWTNYFLGRDRLLIPVGEPQMCDKANSNIMLVSGCVVKEIGIFWDGYEHSCADYDYSMQARKAGFPVLVTSSTCGVCEYDHHTEDDGKKKILQMNFKERKAYFSHPLHSSADILRLKKRNTPLRYPLGVVGRWINLYFPKIYYGLSDIRNT